MNPRRAIVISNCQCLPLACALTVMSAETRFDFWSVHLPPPEEREKDIAEFVARVRQDYELVLCIPLSEEFLHLSSTRIRQTFDGMPVVTISNIYFSGLHPDLCYIVGPGQKILRSPMGDYNSRLALYGFLKTMDAAATQALFCDMVYEKLGYYAEYETSLNELVRRDRGIDVPVTQIFSSILRRFLAMYSINHPTSAVFVHYAHQIVRYLTDRNLGCASGLPPSHMYNEGSLANDAIFPVYPEIAKRHGIAAIGSYAFKPSGERRNPLSLDRFLQQTFASWQELGADTLRDTSMGREVLAVFSEKLAA